MTLPAMIDAYLAGPAALRAAVRGMSREQLTARPVAGKWSTLEVACHLADFDPILADRMKRITGDKGFQDKLAAIGLLPVNTAPVEDVRKYIRAERAKWSGVVKDLGLEGSQ